MDSRWKKAIGLVIAGVILFFMVRSLISGLGELGTYEFSISYPRVVGSFAVLAVLFPVYGMVWQYILRKFGCGISFSRSMRVWFLSQAGRYIPGKVWFALGRIYLCEREGIPRAVATVATGLELVLVLGSAIIVFGIAAALSPSLPGRPYALGLLLVPLIVIAVHPRIIRALLVKLRRMPADFNLAYTDTLKILAFYMGCWCIYGLGYFLIGTSFDLGVTVPDLQSAGAGRIIPDMIGINALSWSAGLVSIVTPAGLGVREGISGILLSRIVDKPYPVLIPLVARIWVTLAEVGTIGIVLLLRGPKDTEERNRA
ncbi:MAG: lysylphosphatidylglycerol synthase domain-containing protein [Candidatus Eisenbacteria bacterium]